MSVIPENISDITRKGLDRVDSLKIGEGLLDLNAFGRITPDYSSAGAALDYAHRVTKSTSLFGKAEVGYHTDDGLYGLAIGGLRMRF